MTAISSDSSFGSTGRKHIRKQKKYIGKKVFVVHSFAETACDKDSEK